MSIQVSYNPRPEWMSLNFPTYTSLLKQFSNTELKTMAIVSKEWQTVVKNEFFLRKSLTEVLNSVSQNLLKRHPVEFDRLNKFTFSLQGLERVNDNFRVFNLNFLLENHMREAVTDYELGTPKLHIWKPLPPHTFTVILGIYIAKLGQTYQKKDVYEADISIIHPVELDSLIDNPKSSSAPFFESKSLIVNGYSYSGFVHFFPGNLSEQNLPYIQSNFSNGLSSGMRSIRQYIK